MPVIFIEVLELVRDPKLTLSLLWLAFVIGEEFSIWSNRFFVTRNSRDNSFKLMIFDFYLQQTKTGWQPVYLLTLRLIACFLRTEASSFCSSRTCVCKSSQRRDFSETLRLQAEASLDRFSCSPCNSSWTLFHLRSVSSNLTSISSRSTSNDLACSPR